MFKGTSKSFQFCYFISSFLLTYCTTLAVLIISNFNYYKANLFNLKNDVQGYHLTLIVLLALSLIALLCLAITKHKILNTLHYSNFFGENRVVLDRRTNYGEKQIILYEVIIPALCSLCLHKIPIFILILLFFWQLFRYLEFSSNRTSFYIYQNSGLIMLGYSFYLVKSNEAKLKYVLINKHQLKDDQNQQLIVIPLTSESNISVLEQSL